MTEKRKYEKPSMKVFELQQQPQLLVGSVTSATGTIDDYEEDNTFSW